MAHIRLEYAEREERDGLLIVEVIAGPAPRAIRPVGQLTMHPAELNALDRLLQRGAVFEAPAHTYTLCRSEREAELDTEPTPAAAQVLRHLARARR